MGKAKEIVFEERKNLVEKVIGVPPTFRKFCTLSYIFI